MTPIFKNHITNYPKGVYLSSRPFLWMDFATASGTFKGLLIKIDTAGLKLYHDPNLFENPHKISCENYYCPDPIPPDRIIEISMETENTNEYEKIDMHSL